jgi:hypothetical protein
MKTFRFYGASDDLFEMECNSKDIQDDEMSEDECYELTSFGDQGVETMIVAAKYCPSNTTCWMIGVVPTDEDIPIPNWPMRFSLSERGYSAQLEIDAPDNTTVRVLSHDSEREDG